MEYFNSYGDVAYRFGNEEYTVSAQDISTYIDIIDQVKNDISVYQFDHINDGDRPDQLSYKLYDTTVYHWTFYLLNDMLRLQGWPLSSHELDVKVKKLFDHIVLTTNDNLTGIFKEGQTVVGLISGATGKIEHRNLDLGQLIIEGDTPFQAGETITSTIQVPGGTELQSIAITSSEDEYNAAHHYINADKEIVDIDPASGPGALLTEVTNYEWYRDENEKLRTVKVIRPEIVDDLVASYRQAATT